MGGEPSGGARATRRDPYSPAFLGQVRAGNVVSISAKGSSVQGQLKRAIRYPPSDTRAKTRIASPPRYRPSPTDALSALLPAKGVAVTARAPSGTGLIGDLLGALLPMLLFIAVMIWLFRRAAGAGGGPLGSFGRSRARRVEPSAERVTFDDIAGIDEAKEELSEIVDFLREPDKYVASAAGSRTGFSHRATGVRKDAAGARAQR